MSCGWRTCWSCPSNSLHLHPDKAALCSLWTHAITPVLQSPPETTMEAKDSAPPSRVWRKTKSHLFGRWLKEHTWDCAYFQLCWFHSAPPGHDEKTSTLLLWRLFMFAKGTKLNVTLNQRQIHLGNDCCYKLRRGFHVICAITKLVKCVYPVFRFCVNVAQRNLSETSVLKS